MKDRTVITVRYRSEDGSYSRPHKIYKIITNGVVMYFPMKVGTLPKDSESIKKKAIDPSTFTTENIYSNNKPEYKSKKTKVEGDVEEIRVKFRKIRTSGKEGFSRPTVIYKVTRKLGDTEMVSYFKYAKYNQEERRYHKLSVLLDEDEFITKWKKGATPTPKNPRNFSDEVLRTKFEWSDEQIKELRSRVFSAKQAINLRKLVGLTHMSNEEAREAILEHGSFYKAKLALADEIAKHKEECEKSRNGVRHMGKITVKDLSKKVKPKDVESGRKNLKNFKGFERNLRNMILFLKKREVVIPDDADAKTILKLFNDEVEKRKSEPKTKTK